MPPARLEARMDSLFSFPVGLFHPLQHAGFDPGAPKLDVTGRDQRNRLALLRNERQSIRLRIDLCSNVHRTVSGNSFLIGGTPNGDIVQSREQLDQVGRSWTLSSPNGS